MNYRTLVKGALALSLSLTVASAMADDIQKYGATFESTADGVNNDFAYGLGTNITAFTKTEGGARYGWLGAAEDESKIIAGGPTGSDQALQLNTDAGVLTNQFASGVAEDLNDGIEADGAYFETEVKFVPSDTLDAGITGGTDATKFAIYAYADENNNTTNLVVFHKYIDANEDPQYTNEQFGAVNCDAYTKLRIEMKKVEDPFGNQVNGFTVTVGNGVPLTSDTAIDGCWFLTVEYEGVAANKEISSLNFKGTGEIDNIKAGVIENYVPDSNWTIEGYNPRNEWTDPTAVAADSKTLFYSNLVVNIDATDSTEGRNIVAAWVGTKVTASEAAIADLSAWNFEYDSQDGTRKTYAFNAAKDGDDFLYWWVPIKADEVRTAIANNTDIVKTMVVYTSSASGEDAQTLTVSICPKDIQITNTDDVADGETIKVVNGVEQYDVSWTVENVTVTTGGAAAVAGYFAPATVLTFTPDTDMVITNIDGQAVANLATFALTVTQATNITVKAGTVQQQVDNYVAGETVDGAAISAGMATWLNNLKGNQSKADFVASLDNDGLTLNEEYLLNTDPTVATTASFTISSIAVGSTVDLQVTLTRTEGGAAVETAINGALKIYGATSLDGSFSADQTVDEDFDDTTTATKNFTTSNKFFKAVIEEVAAE